MTRIAILCARGGSKGVPGKNIRPLAGRPLIAWSINQAREAALFDLIAVSSDDAAILDAARNAGAGLMVRRPDALATDTVSVLPAIVHCLEAAEAHLGRRPTASPICRPPARPAIRRTSPPVWRCSRPTGPAAW